MPRKRRETADIRDPFPQIRETLDMALRGTGQSLTAFARETQVDRHKLTRLLEGENVNLSLWELRQLDQAFAALGVDLVWKKNLPQLVAEVQPVAFLVPVGSTQQVGRVGSRTTTSLWDVRAMNQIRELLGRRAEPRDAGIARTRQAGFLVQPVPCIQPLSAPGVAESVQRLIDGRPPPDQEPFLEDFPFERSLPAWEMVAQRPKAVISFGSPRASIASEHMLRTMFASADEDPAARDFFFVWSDPTMLDRDSRFAELASGYDAARLTEDRDSPLGTLRPSPGCDWFAFRPNREPWQVRRSQRPPGDGIPHDWHSYGIVAAQRRGDQLWIVIAGLTGPDTLSAAFMLESFAPVLVPLQSRETPELSGTVWWVVQTTLHHSGQPLSTDLRTIRNVQRISGPNVHPRGL